MNSLLGIVGLFFNALGGPWPPLFWISVLGSTVVGEIFDNMEMWWLGYWAAQYATGDRQSVFAP